MLRSRLTRIVHLRGRGLRKFPTYAKSISFFMWTTLAVIFLGFLISICIDLIKFLLFSESLAMAHVMSKAFFLIIAVFIGIVFRVAQVSNR